MILFTMEKYEAMGARLETLLPTLRHGQFQSARYDNGELHISLKTPVVREHCVVLGTIAPPDEQLLTVLLLAHTLKKEGAGPVTAILPYLAYSRQDKDKPGESMATAWAGLTVRAAGIDQIITVDVHSLAATQLFGLPLTSLSTAPLFADAIRAHQLTGATIVAPDNGAIPRCEAVKAAAGMPPGEIPYFEKLRVEGGIQHSGPIGQVGAQAVIIDDILDTGTTLVSACKRLAQTGVQEIYIMVTHGLFTGRHWEELWATGVQQIFCTDTVPPPFSLDEGEMVRLSVVPLLQKQLSALAR